MGISTKTNLVHYTWVCIIHGKMRFLKMWKQLWSWVTSIGWESFKVHAIKSQDCHEGTVEGDPGRAQERRES